MRRLGVAGRLAATVTMVGGCSLISTSDLAGGTAATCSGPSCPDAGASGSVDASASDSDACAANVQTDSANCGACGHRCDGGICAAGRCVAGCPGGIVYVSQANGSDSFDGCSEAKPKATVSAGIATAETAGALAREVHVCAGTYTEASIALGQPVALLGGYDCLGWVRTATYGYPTFDGLNRTTLRASAANTSGVTFDVIATAITKETLIDGFRFEGPAVTTAGISSTAFEVAYAAPTIRNNEILAAAQSTAITRGLAVGVNATPEIEKNSIDGGGGDQGVVGLYVGQMSTASIHDNLVTTGKSSAGVAYGIQLENDGDMIGVLAVRNNHVRVGGGFQSGGEPGVNGVFVKDTRADVIGNVIEAGVATCAASVTYCVANALTVSSTDGVLRPQMIAGNRVLSDGASGGQNQLVHGIELSNLGATRLLNNAVDAVGGSSQSGIALDIQRSLDVTAQHNTFYATAGGVAIDPASRLSAENNLFLGSAGLNDNSCNRAGAIGSAEPDVRGNAFVTIGSNIATHATGTTTCSVASITNLTAFDAIVTSAANNVRLRSTCLAGEAGCTVDAACDPSATSPDACFLSVLDSWDHDSQGAANLIDDSRTWKLGTNVPCVIAHGGVDLSSASDGGANSASFDITGAPRTPPVSIGAYESDGTCL